MSVPLFELETPGGRLAIPSRLTRRVELVDELVVVPGTAPPLVGIAEAAGGIVTLLDPAYWSPEAGRRTIVPSPPFPVLTLAQPFAHLALLLGPGARLERCVSSDARQLDERSLLGVVRPGPRRACQ